MNSHKVFVEKVTNQMSTKANEDTQFQFESDQMYTLPLRNTKIE